MTATLDEQIERLRDALVMSAKLRAANPFPWLDRIFVANERPIRFRLELLETERTIKAAVRVGAVHVLYDDSLN